MMSDPEERDAKVRVLSFVDIAVKGCNPASNTPELAFTCRTVLTSIPVPKMIGVGTGFRDIYMGVMGDGIPIAYA